MTYFCYIDSAIMSVPHMEPLDARDLGEARRQAEVLLDAHDSGYAAHVYAGHKRVASIHRSRDPKGAGGATAASPLQI